MSKKTPTLEQFLEANGLEVDYYLGEWDGVPVLHIDTPDRLENRKGPILRVYINDGEVYQNPPPAPPSEGNNGS